MEEPVERERERERGRGTAAAGSCERDRERHGEWERTSQDQEGLLTGGVPQPVPGQGQADSQPERLPQAQAECPASPSTTQTTDLAPWTGWGGAQTSQGSTFLSHLVISY